MLMRWARHGRLKQAQLSPLIESARQSPEITAPNCGKQERCAGREVAVMKIQFSKVLSHLNISIASRKSEQARTN